MEPKTFTVSTGEKLECVLDAVAARILPSATRMIVIGDTLDSRGERWARDRVMRPGVIILPHLKLAVEAKAPRPARILVRGPTELKVCATKVEVRLDKREAKLVRISVDFAYPAIGHSAEAIAALQDA
jgi:hypothetical protein